MILSKENEFYKTKFFNCKTDTMESVTTEQNLPSNKDILRDLISKKEDALEEFVKVHMELFAKVKETEKAKAERDRVSERLSEMSGRDYGFLKAHEREMDEMELDLHVRYNHIQTLDHESYELEEKCRIAEAALNAAKKAESEFLEKIL